MVFAAPFTWSAGTMATVGGQHRLHQHRHGDASTHPQDFQQRTLDNYTTVN